MKWLMIVLLVGLVAYIVMAIQSHRQPDTLGLQQGQLRPCPDSPNCVCSEEHSRSDQEHGIAPLNHGAAVWVQLPTVMKQLGATLDLQQQDYMHFTFSSPVFRYVDDVELRLDRAQDVIHIRSASRIGRSDFGVNRKRVERIRQALADTVQ